MNGKCRLTLLIIVLLKETYEQSLPPSGTPPPTRNPGFQVPTPDSYPGVTGGDDAHRYTVPTTTTKKHFRTTPFRMKFKEECDYLAYYCIKAYKTGVVCGRTIYYRYANFTTYCQLDYVNCMERYEIWQLVHMGVCFTPLPATDYEYSPLDNDSFLDDDYVSDN